MFYGGKENGRTLYLSFNFCNAVKILDLSKSKAFADEKPDVAKIITCIFDRVQNSRGRGENASYQLFSIN